MLPRRKASNKAVQILSEQGTSLIDIEEIDRQNDKLRMSGNLMGGIPTSMYLTVDSFYRMLKMLMGPAPIAFALLSPLYWFRSCRRTHGRRNTIIAVTKKLFLFVIPIALIVSFVVAMVILGIYSLGV